MYLDRDEVSPCDYLDSERPGPGPGSIFRCTACNKEADASWRDTGIGAYEFWGQRGVDRRMELLSDCCGADIIEDNPDDDTEEQS